MAYKINYDGNTGRFHGQRAGKLIDIDVKLAKNIDTEVLASTGKNVPVNSVRQFIVLTFIGDRGIPFQDIINYGGARLEALKKDLGKWFEIDSPTVDAKPLELISQEVV